MFGHGKPAVWAAPWMTGVFSLKPFAVAAHWYRRFGIVGPSSEQK